MQSGCAEETQRNPNPVIMKPSALLPVLALVLLAASAIPVHSEPEEVVDTDGDELSDEWEELHFGNIVDQTGRGDPDADGVSNLDEFKNGTDPLKQPD